MTATFGKRTLAFICAIALSAACFAAPAAWAAQHTLAAGSAEESSVVGLVAQSLKLKSESVKGNVVGNGTFYICADKNKKMVLTASGSAVKVRKRANSKAQQWKLVFNHDSQSYTIVNAKSGKALTVTGSAKNGNKVILSKMVMKRQTLSRYATRNLAVPTQRWIVRSSTAGFNIISVKNPKVTVNLSGKKPAKSNKVRVNTISKAKQKNFWLTGVSGKKALKSGTYTIAPTSSKKLLSVSNASVRSGAIVKVAANANSLGQAFEVKAQGKGYYRIVNVNSGMVLATAGKSKVVQKNANSVKKSAALWKLTRSKSGKNLLVNKATKRALSCTKAGKIKQVKVKKAKVGWRFTPTTTGLTATAKKALYRANRLTSATKYCCIVDMSAHQLYLFKKTNSKHKGGPWVLDDQCRCTIGGNGSHTVACTTTFGNKSLHRADINAKWVIYVHHGSWLHSTLFWPGEKEQLGWNISHGCIRIPFKHAEYIYKTAPSGTKMMRYYK